MLELRGEEKMLLAFKSLQCEGEKKVSRVQLNCERVNKRSRSEAKNLLIEVPVSE